MRPRQRKRILGAFVAAALALPAAEAPAQRAEVRPLERPPLPRFAPRGPDFVLPPVEAEPDRPPPLSRAPRVFVRAYRFDGNAAIPDSELAAVAAPFSGREVTADELQELRHRLTLLYVERGYVTSGALLPDQDASAGVVTYRIVEGTLAEIAVIGTDGLDPGYVRARLALAAGSPLDLNALRDGIRLLLQDPLFERVNAELVPGRRLGESVLNVAVARARPYELRLGFDNAGTPSTGELRGTAAGVLRNLTGRGDSLEVGHGRAQGSRETSLAFELPLGARGARLRTSAELADNRIVEEPLDELGIRSHSRTLEVELAHPLHVGPEDRVEVGASLSRRTARTELLGRSFSFSEGVRDGRSEVTALRLSQTWLRRQPNQVIAARSTLSAGLDLGGITENEGNLPDGRFLSWLGQFQWARRLDERGGQLLVRTDLQLSRDSLLPLEQVAIGGLDTVRGYRENALVRDQGLVASVEGRLPLLRLPVPLPSAGSDDGWLSGIAFVDHGVGWNRDRDTPDPRSVTGVGLGLRWDLSPDLQAQLFYARPLRDAGPEGDSLQERGIHFRLSARVF